MQLMGKRYFLKVLSALVIWLFCQSAEASDLWVAPAWQNLKGHSSCGGLDQYGRIQPPCGLYGADYIGKALTQCPQGTFKDLGSCWACPEGYTRPASFHGIDSDKACIKPAPVQTSSATRVFEGGKCPNGTFLDPRNGGECWQCDPGFGRTLGTGVDEWNACGKFGQRARSATLVSTPCPKEGSFYDPRNGGECWQCPPSFDRTGNPVTGARACKRTYYYSSAINRGNFRCKPGEVFDAIDGGTCWKCENDGKRTWDSVKSKTACRLNDLKWVVPNRRIYGMFGMGAEADEILAKIISERTRIDQAASKMAALSGKPEATVRRNIWDVIDKTPWNSPVLNVLFEEDVMAMATKPVAQLTAGEKVLLSRVATLFQANKRFIAYQAKQAHDTWVTANRMYYEQALTKMGAASVYSDSMVTPPDYNEVVTGAIQVGAGIVGPASAALVSIGFAPAKNFILPYAGRKAAAEAAKRTAAEAAKRVATEVAKEAAVDGAAAASEVTASAVAAAAGPLLVATAAAVIMMMEIDKFMALEKAEALIQNSIRIAERPIDLGALLRTDGGSDEFAFHWAAVLGGEVRPSANFNSRLAAYKSGRATAPSSAGPVASAHPVLNSTQFQQLSVTPSSVPSTGTSNTGPMTAGTASVQMSGMLPGQGSTMLPGQTTPATTTTPRTPRTVEELIENAVAHQSNRPTGKKGSSMRLELSNTPGSCLTKENGTSTILSLTNCTKRRALWITPDARNGALVFSRKYCITSMAPFKVGEQFVNTPLVALAECNKSDKKQKWQLTREGLIQQVGTGLCVSVDRDDKVSFRKCDLGQIRKIWRPWAGK